jgi:hypothetical protein
MITAKGNRLIVGTFSLLLVLSACNGKLASLTGSASTKLSEEEKHRLYAAALAASDSPLDNETFKRTCRAIGVFDEDGRPNNKYLTFVSVHVEWSTDSKSEDFRRQINTRDKAMAYVEQRLP